jgi:predicted transposase YdaD
MTLDELIEAIMDAKEPGIKREIKTAFQDLISESLNAKILAVKREIKIALHALISDSLDAKDRDIIRSRRKFQSDMETTILTSQAIFRQEGRQEGLLIGEEIGSRKLVRALTASLSIQEIAGLTGLPIDEVQRLSSPD